MKTAENHRAGYYRVWDLLPTEARIKLAFVGRLKCFWRNGPSGPTLELGPPIDIDESTDEVARIMQVPPGRTAKGGELTWR